MTAVILYFPRIHPKYRQELPSWLFTPTISGPRFGLRVGRL
jgi:hypothetical protein